MFRNLVIVYISRNGGKKSKEDKPPTLELMSLAQDNPPALDKMEPNPDTEKQESREDTPPRRITRRLSAINSKTTETKPSKSDVEKQEAKKRPAARHSRRIASLSSMPNSSPSCSPPAIAKEAPEYPSSPCPLVAQETTKAEAPSKMPPKSPPPPAEESPPAETEKQPHPLLENLKLLADNATYDGQIPSCKVYGSMHLLRLFGKY